jgi:hypothetical protein
MKEARSYHLRVRSEDDSVLLHDVPRLYEEGGEELDADVFDGATQSSDGYAIYTSKRRRPEHVRMVMRMRLSDDIRRALGLVFFLAVVALVVAAIPVYIDKTALALVMVPATLSATVLFVRERSTLAATLLARYKKALFVTVVLLWGASLLRLSGVYTPGTAPPPDVPNVTVVLPDGTPGTATVTISPSSRATAPP